MRRQEFSPGQARVGTFSVVREGCAPCIRAYANLNQYVTEVLAFLMRGPADPPIDVYGNLVDAVAHMRGCVDDQAYTDTVDHLEKVGPAADTTSLLDAVRPLIERTVADEIAVRCCG